MNAWSPTVAVSNAQRVMRFGVARGVEPSRLNAGVGLALDSPRQHPQTLRTRVAARDMFAMWGVLNTALDRSVPMQVAEQFSLDDLQLLGFTVATAPSVRDGLAAFVKYGALLSDAFSWHWQVGTRSAELRWHCHAPVDLGASLALETSLAQFAVGLRQLAGADVDPLRVCFGHAAPARLGAHRALFRCRIDWNSDAYRVLIPEHVLDATPPRASRELWHYLCAQADQVVRDLSPQPLSARVQAEISSCLSSGCTPRIGQLARRLGLSERSLRRQLASETLSFRSLVDCARRDRARELLQHTDMPIARVAYELGFSDASALTHACQRWFARPPRDLSS